MRRQSLLCSLRHALCALRFRRGAAANENPADRIPNCTSLSAIAARIEASGRVCGNSGMWRGKTSSLSIDLQRENWIVFPRSRPSWCVSRSTSSSQQVRSNPCRQGSDQYDSYCHATILILLAWVRRQPCATGWEHHGVVHLAPELSGKRLELLKETVSKLSRVAVLGNSTVPGNAQR